MDRIGAREFYYYSEEFINELNQKIDAKVDLYLAKYHESLIAAALILRLRDIDYYYLSARDVEYSNVCATNIILDRAILDSKDRGADFFVLGGGHTANDSLSRFKAKFTNTKKRFYRYQKIFNKEIYEELKGFRDEFDKEQNYNRNIDFFPTYRAP